MPLRKSWKTVLWSVGFVWACSVTEPGDEPGDETAVDRIVMLFL